MRNVPYVAWTTKPVDQATAVGILLNEREYQQQLPAERVSGKTHEVGAYIAMILHYAAEANFGWTKCGSDFWGLCGIRKIGALALRCIEENGCPTRLEEEAAKVE